MSCQEASAMVGRQYRTPWEPSGIVEVVAVAGDYFGRMAVTVRFVGDHPHGYTDGSIGHYLADELKSMPDHPGPGSDP